MITTVCKISYGSQTVPPIVPAVQGDTGRAISFEIADFTPPAGATATYFILKPSGEAIYNSATITDNSILCELTAQSLAEAGENRMQVRVLHGEDIVTSFEVILMVRTFLGDDAIQSGTEMNIFDQAVEQATEQFQTNAEQVVEEVIESIPADYTELTEEVDELNERLSDLIPLRYISTISDTLLEKGGYTNGVKDSYREGNRARTITKFCADKDINIFTNGTVSTARVIVEYFDAKGTYLSNSGWVQYITIPKGQYFDLIFTTAPTGTVVTATVSEILSAFIIASSTEKSVDATNESLTAVNAIITQTNTISQSAIRITCLDYIELDDIFLSITVDSGYQVYVVYYDEDFNIVDYGSVGWQTGTMFAYHIGAKYIRFSMAKSSNADIDPSEISHITFKRYVPNGIEHYSDGNIISIAKDGINDEERNYAPKFPKSSIESFNQAFLQGFRTVMAHVQFTTDGVPVVYHDQTINTYARNADGTTISETVYIRQSTLAELDEYDFGIYFGSAYARQKITRFIDVLAFCKYRGLQLIIEPTIRLSNEELETLADLIKNYNMASNIGYVETSVAVMGTIKTTFPKGWLFQWVNNEEGIEPHIANIINLKTDDNKVFLYMYGETVLSESMIKTLYENDIGVVKQTLQGTEPSNIITTMQNQPYTNAIVSQILPAYVVGQYDAI